MNTLLTEVVCLECGHTLAASLFPGNCPECGSGWMDARYDLNALPQDWQTHLQTRPTDLWRYRELLPFPANMGLVSMGEGWTPLTRAEGLETELGHGEIWIKDERQQPTGSFKDRQASGAVSALKAAGVKEMALASTGNAAAAYAAYCARAGIKLWVFLTSSVPAEKMRELGLYGAEVVKITGTYDQAKHIAADFASRKGIHFDAGAKAVPNKECMKTIAYEIVEQLGWQAPDWYIQAVSGGLGPLGVQKGFQELYRLGLIDRIPKMGIVQVDGCAPMARAWEQGLDKAEDVVADTLISVLSTGSPGLAYELLNRDMAQHGGAMVSVSDGEAFRAMRQVARLEGFSVEPAASVAFAGLQKLVADGHIRPDERVVVNCSGHTFSAEKHALEDRYIFDLSMDIADGSGGHALDGLGAALNELDEQVTTIVIIDDNPQDSRLIRKLLQRHKKYRIVEANTARDGIDFARQRRPDLILLDLTLPDMDGFGILDSLKSDERTRDIPVMIVSGKDLTPDQQAYLDSQTESVLQKGNFSSQELLDQVVDMLKDEGAITAPAEPTGAWLADEDSTLDAFGSSRRPVVLIVDDNIWDVRLMRRHLEIRHRFDVEAVHNARAAKDFINRNTPDLVLLDLMMPDLPGEELLTWLRGRAATQATPVVVLTGKDLSHESRSELISHVDSVWSKSGIDRNTLLSHVENLLAK